MRPSGENATALTAAAWPVNVRAGAPVARSQSPTVPSSPAVARSEPSGLRAASAMVTTRLVELANQGARSRRPRD